MPWILWQVVISVVLTGLAGAFFWLTVTRRMPQEPRGWVWGRFKPRGLDNPSPNDLLGIAMMMALVGIAHGIGSVLMWIGFGCCLLMMLAATMRALQLR